MRSEFRLKVEEIIGKEKIDPFKVFIDGYPIKKGRRWRIKFGGVVEPLSPSQISQIKALPGVLAVRPPYHPITFRDCYAGWTITTEIPPSKIVL